MPPSTLPPPDHVLPFGPVSNPSAPAAGTRRKTPSELRQEQLNRTVRSRNFASDVTGAAPSTGSIPDQRNTGFRLVDNRLGDIFAATKSDGPKVPLAKQQDGCSQPVSSGNAESFRAVRSSAAEGPCPVASQNDGHSGGDCKSLEPDQSYGKFRDVTQLSSRHNLQASTLGVDMAEALKILAPTAKRHLSRESRGPSHLDKVPCSLSQDAKFSYSTLKSSPVDFSLKLSARFLSVNSLLWCHRISPVDEAEGLKGFVEKLEQGVLEDPCSGGRQNKPSESGLRDRFRAQFCQALHSWVHPPPQYLELYDLAFANARRDTRKSIAVSPVHQMWEDAFRSLYYMFRHDRCHLFYVCTRQFVVMFERGSRSEGDEAESNAYWTRSTRVLRKRLKEQGVQFSMPLCSSEVEKSAAENLDELTEYEKFNPGQTRVLDPMIAVDNNSQSLLAFEAGHVHRLFDFLLNYRHLVTSADASEIPILYSPTEFCNASLYSPEVKCMHVQHSGDNTFKDLTMSEGMASEFLYSLELKGPSGAYITPWVSRRVCSVLQKSQSRGFEVSFATTSLSEALNIAQEKSPAVEADHVPEKGSKPSPTGVSVTNLSVVKHLRYSDASYLATMASIS